MRETSVCKIRVRKLQRPEIAISCQLLDEIVGVLRLKEMQAGQPFQFRKVGQKGTTLESTSRDRSATRRKLLPLSGSREVVA